MAKSDCAIYLTDFHKNLYSIGKPVLFYCDDSGTFHLFFIDDLDCLLGIGSLIITTNDPTCSSD